MHIDFVENCEELDGGIDLTGLKQTDKAQVRGELPGGNSRKVQKYSKK